MISGRLFMIPGRFLLFVSFYYITKKRLTRFDIVMVAIFAGLSFTLKYQAAIIVIGFLIFFLIFQKPRIKKSIIFNDLVTSWHLRPIG